MRNQLPNCLTPGTGDDRVRPVLDVYDLAVRLEIEGISDAVARADYGFSSTLAMSQEYFNDVRRPDPPIRKPAAKIGFLQFLNGISFAIPAFLCTAATLFYHLSLWGGDLSPEAASALAIGTVCSFIATGGIVQASARRMLTQIHMNDWDGAAFTCRRWTVLGVGVALAVLVTGWLLNQYFRWLPYPMDWVALSFHLGLSLLWLACGTLYVLDLSAAVGGAVIVGIAAVAFLHRFLGQPLLVSQFAGILVTAALSFLIAALALRRKARWKSEGEFLSARILHGVAPYFVYGVCYYLFLFADRLLAWTAQTTAFTMPIRFLGEYETALDIAMVAFVIESGWVHLSMLSFYRHLNNGQAHNSAADSPAFNRELRNYYFRRGAIFLPLATVTGFLTYGVAMHFGVLPTPGMQKVAVIAVASYPLLVWGLWNVGLFFALSRPRNALIAITAALSVNVGLGYLFSRVGNYNDAVFGFAVGSLVFALLTTVLFLRLCRTIDYCHFASAA